MDDDPDFFVRFMDEAQKPAGIQTSKRHRWRTACPSVKSRCGLPSVIAVSRVFTPK